VLFKLNFLVRYQIPTTSYSTGISKPVKNIGLYLRLQLFSFSNCNLNPNPTHLPNSCFLSSSRNGIF